MRYNELLSHGEMRLEAAGVPDAKVDAWLLLSFVCDIDRQQYFLCMLEEVSTSREVAYNKALKRRCSREPLQHITQSQSFMGLDFYVNKDVLIPRQDTEILVEKGLELLGTGGVASDPCLGNRILDLCTGSGCILLSLLHMGSADCTGVGVDISSAALSVAQTNAESLGLMDRVEFIEGDLFAPVSGKFNLITSNPPYIPSNVIEGLMPEVRDFEPRLALDGTADGLAFYRRICEQAPAYLPPGGWLLFEIGHDQGLEVSGLMRESAFSDVQVAKDLCENDRIVFGHL